MPVFRITFRIEPIYVFGIRTSSMEVIPVHEPPTLVFDHNTYEQWVTRPDGTSGERRSDEMMRVDFSVDGISFVWTDSMCTATLDAPDGKSAVNRADTCLTRILHLLMGTTPGVQALLTSHVVDVSVGGRPLKNMVSDWLRFRVYDNLSLAANIIETVELTSHVPSDKRLDRSLMYMGIGDAMSELFGADTPDEYSAETLPIQFLQYWKALTVIAGDASRDKDHQIRPTKLGLGREFFRQRVKPLNELRDRSDVAHSINPRDARAVSSDDVTECREVATIVIRAFCERLIAERQSEPKGN